MSFRSLVICVFCSIMLVIACRQRPVPAPERYRTTCGYRHQRYESYAVLSGIDLKVQSFEVRTFYTADEKAIITKPGGFVLSKVHAPFPSHYRYFYDGQNSRVEMSFDRKRYTSFSALNSVIHDTLIEIRDSSGIISYKGYFRKPLNGLAPKGGFTIFGWMTAQPVKEEFYGQDGKLRQENHYNSKFKLWRTRYWNHSAKLIATETTEKLTFYFKEGRTEFVDTIILGHKLQCKKKFDRESRLIETAYYEGNKEVYNWRFYDRNGIVVNELVKSTLLKRTANPEGLYEDVLLIYADERPEFPGGNPGFERMLRDHLDGAFSRYDEFLGKYEVIFAVERDGHASIDTIVKFPAFHPNSIVHRNKIIAQLHNAINKQWRPGKVNGRPVKYYFKLNFRIDLSD